MELLCELEVWVDLKWEGLGEGKNLLLSVRLSDKMMGVCTPSGETGSQHPSDPALTFRLTGGSSLDIPPEAHPWRAGVTGLTDKFPSTSRKVST